MAVHANEIPRREVPMTDRAVGRLLELRHGRWVPYQAADYVLVKNGYAEDEMHGTRRTRITRRGRWRSEVN